MNDLTIRFHALGGAVLAVSALLLSVVSGCGYLRQTQDHTVPKAVPAMIAAQTLNPEAGKNQKVVAGLDGPAAIAVSEGYSKSFVKKQGGQKAASDYFVGLDGAANN